MINQTIKKPVCPKCGREGALLQKGFISNTYICKKGTIYSLMHDDLKEKMKRLCAQ